MANTGETQEIVAQVLQSLRRIIRSVDLHSQVLKKNIGLTGPQLLVLTEIKREPGLSSGEVARRVNLSHPTVTSILDRLEARNLITRTRAASDKRRVELHITQSAAGLLERSPVPLQEEFIRNFELLEDWEQSQILSSLQRMAHLMHAESLPAEPVLSVIPLEHEAD